MNDKKEQNQPPIRLSFDYEGKIYNIELRDDITFVDEIDGDENWFWWEEGNGACDCNRSSTIKRFYPEFPELKCGDKIELIDCEIIK